MLFAPGPGKVRNKSLCNTSQSASKFTACYLKVKMKNGKWKMEKVMHLSSEEIERNIEKKTQKRMYINMVTFIK